MRSIRALGLCVPIVLLVGGACGGNDHNGSAGTGGSGLSGASGGAGMPGAKAIPRLLSVPLTFLLRNCVLQKKYRLC